MGGSVSQVFRSGSALLTHRDGHKVSESTIDKIQMIFEILRTNPRVRINTLEALLVQIPRYENILAVQDDTGYNLLQRSIGLNHIDLVRWLLQRHCLDLNRSPCSLPLHIACLKGYDECVELLLKHGARIDTEARMCFPGLHSHFCEERGRYKGNNNNATTAGTAAGVCDDQDAPGPTVVGLVVGTPVGGGGSVAAVTKLQNSLCYAIDGDQINVLNMLSQRMEEPWIPFRVQRKKPLLHLACERGAWKCVQQLVIARSEEINSLKDEYYPIHQAILHDLRFLDLLIQHGADTNVRTCTQQMTLLHVVLLHARKSADDVLQTLRILLERGGCKELINAPDSLGNTPLHALIVRYALEEPKYGYDKWNKWDLLHLARFLLQNGAKYSINQTGNSALACVFRHIRDWDVCYEILTMLIKEGGDPNIVGRDGSVPLMVCLVPLINKDPLHHFSHTMKVCYLNCIRILLEHGANPNAQYRATLTPLHVLIFTVSENFTLICEEQKRMNFDFIKNILLLLLQHGLDVNQNSEMILQSCIDMVQNVRTCGDMQCLYELTLILVQYGANVNINSVCDKFNYLDTMGGGRQSTNHHQQQQQAQPQGSSSVNTALVDGAAIASASSTAATQSEVATNMSSGSSGSTGANSCGINRERNSFRNAKNNLLFYYLMLINKKEFLLCDHEQAYVRIINLFYMTMEHTRMYNCLRNLNNMYMTQVPNKTQEGLVQYLAMIYRRPRTLKQSCRLAIYEALNRRLAQNINRLNLPNLLKDFLFSFE